MVSLSPMKEISTNKGEIDGYHFSYFKETFIHRDKLPLGSSAFQEVLKEISEEDEAMGSRMPAYIKTYKSDRTETGTGTLGISNIDRGNRVVTCGSTTKVRRKSAPVFFSPESFRPSTVSTARSVHWGESQTSVCSMDVRPRVLSDGSLIYRKGILKKTSCIPETTKKS